MGNGKKKNGYLAIFAIIGVICAIASIVYVIMTICKKEHEYDHCEFDWDEDDDECECGHGDEDGCAYTGDEDFEK